MPEDSFSYKSPLNPASNFRQRQGELKIALNSNMELVIIRPPLVYGADVRGIFNLLAGFNSFQFPLES